MAAMRTAVKLHRTGTYNAAELEAPARGRHRSVVATYAVEYNVAALGGALIFIYGLELTRPEALLLREQVTALGVQVPTCCSSLTPMRSRLSPRSAFPKANALALVADWTALKHRPPISARSTKITVTKTWQWLLAGYHLNKRSAAL